MINELIDSLPTSQHGDLARAADAIIAPAFAAMGYSTVCWEGGEPCAMRVTRYIERNNPNSVRMEYEANWFAGSFFMPEREFRKVWREMKGEVLSVASLFGVPARLALVRAETLRLEAVN